MATARATAQRLQRRDETLDKWVANQRVDLRRLDDGQRWVVFAALQSATKFSELQPLRRVLAYVLAHCEMAIPGAVSGVLTGVTDRSIRETRNLSPEELLHSVRTVPRGRGKPKLGPESAGVVAKYLVEHPRARSKDLISYVLETLGVELDRKTMRVYLQRYGLGCLRQDTHTNDPLF